MLHVVRSVKNTFAPINRIPPELLSLIPEHCKKDRELIELTHICHDWREIFVSRASLWTRLDCARPNKKAIGHRDHLPAGSPFQGCCPISRAMRQSKGSVIRGPPR